MQVRLPAGECRAVLLGKWLLYASRVAVDTAGDAYIASRGIEMQVPSPKIASTIDRCLDRNDNGRIDTAAEPNPETMATMSVCFGRCRSDPQIHYCAGSPSTRGTVYFAVTRGWVATIHRPFGS